MPLGTEALLSQLLVHAHIIVISNDGEQSMLLHLTFRQVMAEEFSHTVIHRKPLGVFGQQRMPPKQPVKPAPGQYSNVALLK